MKTRTLINSIVFVILILICLFSTRNVQATYTDSQVTVGGAHSAPSNQSLLQTSICGAISDSHWTLAGSPYTISCNSSLNSGSLTIDPGVTVQFQPGARLDVSGNLQAQGNAGNPIYFTSSSATPSRGNWNGLFFHSGSSASILRYVVIEYGSGISIDNSSPLIDDSTIRYHSSSGIYLNNSQSTISHNTIFSNTASSGAGINIDYGRVTIDSNSISWNNSSARGGGIRGYGFGASAVVTITNNIISNNSTGSYGGAGILLDSANGTILNNTITDNSAGTGCGGGVNISGASGPSVLVQNNVILRNSGGGSGICTDAFTTITGNLIAYNSGSYAGIAYNYPGGTHSPSSIPVTCNTIIGNIGPSGLSNGVYTVVSSPFHRNTIYGNSGYQFQNGGAPNVDSTANYWGTTDSTQIAAGIVGAVSYSPFLNGPDACAPMVGPSYSISGRVTDDMGNSAPGVTLTASNGSSAITNASGYYTITNLITGTYVITPTMTGYRFAPTSISSIGVPPDITGKDFKIRPAVPGTFLDLPVYYQDLMAVRSEAFVVAALGSNGGQGPGRVNSWFDHEVPLYNQPNNILTRWDGQDFHPNDMISVDNCSTPPGKLGDTCYDYHNGIDLRQKTKYVDEFVLAAGAGIVITPTITGYGNAVMINHQNGYATFYGHLKDGSILVHPGGNVTIGQKVGTMGNTGPGSKGPHLHFGVYYDKNGDKNSYGIPNWTEQEVVDPYGWIPQTQLTRSDPWSVSSFPLWVYSLNGQCTLTSAGISKTSASGKVIVTAPPNAVSSPVTLEIWDTPPAAGASAQLRSAGRSFWVRVLEWLSGNSAISRSNSRAASGSFAQPLTLQVGYGITETQHLDTSLLSLYRWNTSAWLALPTTIDQGQKRTSAQTTETGNFDLQAPLLCPSDSWEVDDTFDAAHRIMSDGTTVIDLFDIAQDEDWFRLDAIGGIHYIVKTRNLASGVDTILQVYDLDGTTVIASDDNGGGGKASRLVWQAPQDGPYFIRVSQAPGSSFGCGASYQLRVIQEGDVFLPFIRK